MSNSLNDQLTQQRDQLTVECFRYQTNVQCTFCTVQGGDWCLLASAGFSLDRILFEDQSTGQRDKLSMRCPQYQTSAQGGD